MKKKIQQNVATAYLFVPFPPLTNTGVTQLHINTQLKRTQNLQRGQSI